MLIVKDDLRLRQIVTANLVAHLASLGDETSEGRGIVALARRACQHQGASGAILKDHVF